MPARYPNRKGCAPLRTQSERSRRPALRLETEKAGRRTESVAAALNAAVEIGLGAGRLDKSRGALSLAFRHRPAIRATSQRRENAPAHSSSTCAFSAGRQTKISAAGRVSCPGRLIRTADQHDSTADRRNTVRWSCARIRVAAAGSTPSGSQCWRTRRPPTSRVPALIGTRASRPRPAVCI